MKKNIIKKSMSVLLAASMALTSLTGIPATKAQAATAKPVIKCSKVKIKNSSCTIKVGQKVNLTAKSGKTNVTKKGTWKSSKKTVATISKAGKLTAKKAGNTNITITYKKKTSKKLKVVVKKKATTATPAPKPTNTATPYPTESSKPNATSNPTTTTKPVPGAYVVRYNPNGGTLSGSNTQSVKGEILKFPEVKAPSGKKFIGWYDKKSGGNRIYETYVPTDVTELFAHYVDEDQKTQRVTFSLGCNYGGTYSFMGGDSNLHVTHYDWLNKKKWCGPLRPGDDENVEWNYNFVVENNKITIDSLPTPEVPGYTFVGWYTTSQNYLNAVKDGRKVNIGDKFDVSDEIFILFPRFTKKITISFDDFRHELGTYDDIVIDSYSTFAEAGKNLPVPKIPGATFVGWTMDTYNHDLNWVMPIITNDTMFLNCIEWCGFECSGCDAVSKDRWGRNATCSPDCSTHFVAVNDDWHVYEETDHFTVYPVYKYEDAEITYDLNGGHLLPGYDLIYDESGNPVFDPDLDYHGKYIQKGLHTGEPLGTLITPSGVWSYGSGYRRILGVKRDYYEFDGWYYLDADGNEQEFTLETNIYKSDMQVYAKWKPGKSTVWFQWNPYSGDFMPDDEAEAVGLDSAGAYEIPTESTIAEAGKRLPIPQNKDGRKFLYWSLSGSNEPFTEDTPIIGVVDLYARWGPLPKDLPIKLDFDPNGGTFDDSTFENNISGNRGTSFNTFPSVSKDDYDFMGWYVLKPGATDYNDDNSFIQMVGKTLSITNDMVDDLGDDDDDNDKVTLVARWAEKGHAQSITMLGYNTDTYKTNPVEDGESFDLQYDTTGEFLYQFRATVLPETIDNRDVIWSSSDPNIVYISGANADGTYVTRNNAYLTRLKLADGLEPTKEGYDVTLTARSADVASVTFTIKLHISFPEDQIPVTVNFNAGTYGVFMDANGEGFVKKTFDVKRSKNLMSIIGSETPVLDPKHPEYWDSKGLPRYEFIGWEVATANGEVIDVTDDMKASDFNGLDVIEVVAV